LVLTADRDPRRLAECLEAGADGVFDKSQPFEHLVDLLRDAASGFSVMSLSAREELLELLRQSRMSADRRTERFDALTPREREVLAGLLAGRSAEEMARAAGVAVSTIRSHVKGVLRKLGVNSQLAAVALAREWDWSDSAG
jgi:DNA-binding NarL/FixJ family response regulator